MKKFCIIGLALACVLILIFSASFASSVLSTSPAINSPPTPNGIGDWTKLPFRHLYEQSAAQCPGEPPEVVGAIHWEETRQSGDTNECSSAGACGPGQFLPSTFAQYAAPGANINSVVDSMMATGRLLCANGVNGMNEVAVKDAFVIYECGHPLYSGPVNERCRDVKEVTRYSDEVFSIAVAYANQALAELQGQTPTITGK